MLSRIKSSETLRAADSRLVENKTETVGISDSDVLVVEGWLRTPESYSVGINSLCF